MMWPWTGGTEKTSVPQLHRSTPKEEIAENCVTTERLIYSLSNQLPITGTVLALHIVDDERRIISLAKELDAATEHNLRQMVQEYLPELLKTYSAAYNSGIKDEETFIKNMITMLESVQRIFEAVKNDNAHALQSQNIFLESKFGGNTLE